MESVMLLIVLSVRDVFTQSLWTVKVNVNSSYQGLPVVGLIKFWRVPRKVTVYTPMSILFVVDTANVRVAESKVIKEGLGIVTPPLTKVTVNNSL
jgi:hypothetical protein